MSHSKGFLKILFDDIDDGSSRQRILPFCNSDLYHSHIKSATKLTQGEDVKDVYQIILNTKDISYNFQPGDTIGILPNNNLEEVENIFKYLDIENVITHKCRIILTDEKKKKLISHIPVNTTLKEIFLKHVDIRSPPKKAFLKSLAMYTENEEERSILEKLSSPSNSDNYITFISDNGRSLIKLLQTFPSCKVPVERILENLPPLQPRAYSISSSPLLENEIHITFSVEYFDKEVKGICTGWLENIITPILKNRNVLPPEENILFYFRKPNSFRLNSHINTPIIMIGPGTGVAPFIGFLQHLFLEQKFLNTWLFYGCRYKNRDYLYSNNLEDYTKKNYLSKLSVAFSRDYDGKLYVQDIVIKESAEVYKKLVTENATVYVCGDIKNMMKNVKESVKTCLIKNGMTVENANLFVSDMVKAEKYVEDQWI